MRKSVMKTLARISRRQALGVAKFCLAVVVVFIVAVVPRYLLAQSPILFSKTSVVIETGTGVQQFTMELAKEPGQHAQGLMGRQSLAADSGMLFVYAPPRRVSMWMKDTLIPLDMLFVRPDGIIESIVERTTPLSLTTIRSDQPVRAVIELNAGTAKRLRIEAGNRVTHDVFKSPD
jgi:uncharacterized protein